MLDRSILPQLAANVGWLRMIANAAQLPLATPEPAPDPAAERIRAKKLRKRAKRLGRALAGHHTRTTRAA